MGVVLDRMIDKGPENWYEEGVLTPLLNQDAHRHESRFPRLLHVDGRARQRYLRPLAPYFHRPGPEPICINAELLTIALVSEWCGGDRESDLIACWQPHRNLFPQLPSRTRFNRCRRALHEAFALLRQAILAVLDLA